MHDSLPTATHPATIDLTDSVPCRHARAPMLRGVAASLRKNTFLAQQCQHSRTGLAENRRFTFNRAVELPAAAMTFNRSVVC
jgi:hypothetical protein